MPGVYDVQKAFFAVKGVYTNTTPIDAYRGRGAAGGDLRHRAADGLVGARPRGGPGGAAAAGTSSRARSSPTAASSGELYDVGDFERVLDRALVEADVAGFAARKAASARAGRLRGLGLCYYIEVDPRRPERDDDHRLRRGRHGRAATSARSRTGRGTRRPSRRSCRAERHPVREDALRAGRQRPDRQGRRHRRVALGDDAGELDQPRRRRR